MKFEYKDISEKRIKELEKAGLNSIFVPEFGAYNPHLACWSYNCCSEDEEYIIDGSFGSVPYRAGIEEFPYLFIYHNDYVMLFVTFKKDNKEKYKYFYVCKNKKIEESKDKWQLLRIIKDALVANQFDPYLAKGREYLNDFTFKVFYDEKEILS